MGNQQSNQKNNELIGFMTLLNKNKHFQTQFVENKSQQQLYALFEHIGLKDLNKLKNSENGERYSLNCLQFNDNFSFQKVHQRLSNRVGVSHLHVLNIKNITISEQKHLCSMTRNIYISQQGYNLSLKDLISQKQQQKNSFSENEILIILSKIVKALISMHDNQFRNIPLDTQSVLFCKNNKKQQHQAQSQIENYKCKIIDQDIVQKNSYRLFLQKLLQKKAQQAFQQNENNNNLYMSPELLEQAKINNSYPTNLTSKSDIFTLGMIMMEICCQEEMYFCYDFVNLTFDYESLIHRIAKISYSNELKLLIAEMLEYDQNNRIGFVSLNQKLDKLIMKPFEETKKLKRRSSSTMLKELLSCSRASATNTNKQENNIFNNIESLKNSDTKRKQTLQVSHSLNKNQSLKKSSSLVSLKCKPSSFLTSKKVTLNRSNSNLKTQCEDKGLTQRLFDTQNCKIDYKNIIKNRMKTEAKVIDCPKGDLTTRLIQPQTNSKFVKNEVFYVQNNSNQLHIYDQITERPNNYFQVSQSNKKTIQTKQIISNEDSNNVKAKILMSEARQLKERKYSLGNFSYVQKKVINLDKINLSSSNSSQKKNVKKSKSIQSNHLNLKDVAERNIKGQTQKQKFQQNQKIQKKSGSNRIKQTSILQKNHINLNLKPSDNENKKQTQKNNKSNKNWIIQKLKNKNSTLNVNNTNLNSVLSIKHKSTGKVKQTSLSKKKNIICIQNLSNDKKDNQTITGQNISSIQRYQNLEQNLSQQKEKTQTFNKNDTIIKRLELTEQKDNDFQSVYQRNQQNIKGELQMIDKFLERCNLSSRKWDDIQEEQTVNKDNKDKKNQIRKSFVHENYVTYPEFKEKYPQSKQKYQQIQQINTVHKSLQNAQNNNQFKKKSKIIDIDLGNFSKPKLLQSEAVIKDEPQTKRDKHQTKRDEVQTKRQTKKSSKLTKLKQLTIFTEQQDKEQNKKIVNNRFPEEYEQKQNNMKNNNLQTDKIQNTKKIKQIEQTINQLEGRNNNSNKQPSFQYSSIPYKRVQYVNLARIHQDITTPNSLNDLNKIYGNGMTLKSIDQSYYGHGHKKDYSTLTKPFQQIQLNYTGNQPEIKQLQLHIQNYNQQKDQSYESQAKIGKSSITKKPSILMSINADQLTFRIKPKSNQFGSIQRNQSQKQKQTKVSNLQKVNHFQKRDGSFVMRQQNPLKNIQSSSIIGQDKSKNTVRNTVEQLFQQSIKNREYCNKNQDHFQGYNQSFQESDNSNDFIAQSQELNSSCNSIDLSEIQATCHRNSAFLFPQNQKQRKSSSRRKHKHVSILESYQQPEQKNSFNSRGLNINLKNIKQNQINKHSYLQTIRSSRLEEYNTYRRYLMANQFSSRVVQLDQNFFYEGQVNQDEQFEGNGMIYRRNEDEENQNNLVYKGLFVNGLYHGFGTLYQIDNASTKVIKLPNTNKRISFGSNNSAHQKSNKYYSISPLPIKYEGQFKQGRQNGFGTYYFENGDKFLGCFRNGVIEGYGRYHFFDNEDKIQGMWKNFMFVFED